VWKKVKARMLGGWVAKFVAEGKGTHFGIQEKILFSGQQKGVAGTQRILRKKNPFLLAGNRKENSGKGECTSGPETKKEKGRRGKSSVSYILALAFSPFLGDGDVWDGA